MEITNRAHHLRSDAHHGFATGTWLFARHQNVVVWIQDAHVWPPDPLLERTGVNDYGFMPHGFCFEWRPGVLWLHVISDFSIAFSYFGISFLLLYLVQRRRDLPFQLLFILFSAFIILCGTTHLLSIWVLWHPNYYIEGYVKALTAVVSLITFGISVTVLPRALQTALSLEALVVTRGKELEDANAELRAEIAARETIESTLRQSQKMEAIGQLTGGIAHDFNNMLQAIGGSMELAQRRIAQGRMDEAGRHTDSVRQTVERAAALTNRLLAFARRQPLQPRAVQLDDLILGMEELLRRTLGSASAAISFDLRLQDGGWSVLCDPNQLESALLNITINARDAMPNGGSLVISTSQVSLSAADLAGQQGVEPGEYVELVIADTGTGMDEATRLRVFEPFFTTKPTGRGTGLGLSQVYGFARQSGGLVTVESRQGIGTNVHLFLRRAIAAADLTVPEDLVPAATGNARLLLVEDEPIGRKIAAEYLREHGYEVLEAEDGPTAIELFRRTPVLDILITDVGLPNGLNGRQLADIIRETSPAMPVLFITGYAGAARIDQLEAGMQILTKPFSLPKLTARIEAALAARSFEARAFARVEPVNRPRQNM
jgi:signal transduction histidine kinase/ActR/RegA family two-component response regulator